MSLRAELSGVSLCSAYRPDGSLCGLPASIVGPAGGMVCLLHAPKPNMHPLAPPFGDALLLPLPEVMRRLRTHVSWGERADGVPVDGDRFTPAIAASVLAHIEAAEQERDALATELRHVRGRLVEVEMERDAARAECERLRDHLMFVLPMARGYAAAHPVGRNQEMCDNAAALLAPGSSAGGNDVAK